MTFASEFNRPGLVERAKNILLKPVETWNVIAVEAATTKGLFTGYAAILAAIPPVATFIGGQVFGHSFFGVTYRAPLVGALVGAILQYILGLVGLFIFAEAFMVEAEGHGSDMADLKAAVATVGPGNLEKLAKK
jgi:hypothetical protein